MVKPITPKQVEKAKAKNLPDEVIQAFNDVIVENWNGQSAVVDQTEIVRIIASKLEINTQEVFDKDYLNIESIYEKAGWDVSYYEPKRGDDSPATFTFRKRR